MKISLAMIARDNDDVLEATLESVKSFIDEIVVVDTGSVDGTISVAESCGASVYEFEWINDFSAARNLAFSKCSGDWIMWLDTGDVIPESSAEALVALKTWLSEIPDGDQPELIQILLNRVLDEDGNPEYNYPVPRMARCSANPKWERPIHEVLTTDNNVSMFYPDAWVNDTNLIDHSERNLEMLIALAASGDTSIRTLSYLALEFYEQGRYEEALQTYDSIIFRGEDGLPAYEALIGAGKCHRHLSGYESALNAWLEACRLDSTRADAWLLIGDIFYEQEEFAKAIPFFQAATSLTRPLDTSMVNLSYYSYLPWERLGFCQLGLNQDDKAVEALQKAAYYAPPKKAEMLIDLLDTLTGGNDGSDNPLGA